MRNKKIEIIPIYYDYVLKTNYPVYILVGGRNSGKSYFMEQLAVVKMHNSKTYKLLVIEDVEVNIGAGVKDGIESRIEDFEYSSIFKSVKQPPLIEHIVNNNNVIFKGYHSKEQQKQVKSLNEVTAAWYEEAENITYEQFKALRMQLRGGSEEDRQLFLTMNPINEDGFICQYFFKTDPDEVIEKFSDGRPKVFVKNIVVDIDDEIKVSIPCMIIVSTHWDNPYLSNEQRADIEELKYTNIDLYRMLAEGKFVKGQGAYFSEFEKYIHVIQPYIVPKEHRRYRVLDYGLDKLACYWVEVDNQNRLKVYKELWISDLIISEAAKKILDMTNDDEVIYKTIAPPDLWNRRQDTGKSAAQIFDEHGVHLTKADNSMEQGCFDLKEWLKPYKSRDEQTGAIIDTADLLITSNCPELIRSLEGVVKDEKNPNVYSKEPHIYTHSVDAIRYLVAGRPKPAMAKKLDPIYNFNFEKPKRNPLGKGNKLNVI